MRAGVRIRTGRRDVVGRDEWAGFPTRPRPRLYGAGAVGGPVAGSKEVEDRLGIRAVRAGALSRSGLRNVNLVRQN